MSRAHVRGGSGLGDAIYLQSVARHLARDHDVTAHTDYADVFRPLAGRVKVGHFRRDGITHVAHYSSRRRQSETTQFQDCCINARINEPVDLRLDWRQVDGGKARRYRRDDMPLVLVQAPRAPFGNRPDCYGIELLPDFQKMQRAIDLIAARATVVQVGTGKPLYEFSGIDEDLTDRTSVIELIDLCAEADGFLGYVSYMIPMAEALKKPALFIWSHRGLLVHDRIIKSITPDKIFHGNHCKAVFDNADDREMRNAANTFFDLCRREALV